MSKQDLEAASRAYRDFLIALGLEDSGIDLEDSARNTSILMSDRLRGLHEPKPSLSLMPAMSQDLVVLKDLPFYSFCAHHFVPFFGTIQISYHPQKVIAGLGGFLRIIDHYARRPQFQENLCAQIADHLFEELHPRKLCVKLVARQMCVELHGSGNQSVFESEAIRELKE